jgi:predicted peptidase
VFGHFLYTPSGYESDTSNYPLILFMHGYGERGDSRDDATVLHKVKTWGPPKLIETGKWNPSYPFIVASLQLVTEYWASDEIHEFIEYLIKKYRMYKKRIYVTGLSQGGGGSWYYVGERDDHYAAAIVPISAHAEQYLIKNLKKVPIWAFRGDSDGLVDPYKNFGSVTMVEAINLSST